MKFPKLISFFSKPRDRILSAVSVDGVQWRRERGVRINSGKSCPPGTDMAYYCFVHHGYNGERNYEMFYHAGEELSDGNWFTKIMRATSPDGLTWSTDVNPVIVRGAHPLCEKRVIAPYLVHFKDFRRLYFTGVCQNGVYRILSAVSKNRKEWVIEPGSRIEPDNCNAVSAKRISNTDITGVSDTSIVQLKDGSYRMYFTAIKKTIFHQDIRSAVSIDGLNWSIEDGIRIPAGGKDYKMIANNPCVIPFENGWRMYFRGTDRLPLWSNIFVAFSDDGIRWDVQGITLKFKRYAKYERHGVAFPFVMSLDNSQYRMYYTGYWGNLLDHSAVNYYLRLYEKEGII